MPSVPDDSVQTQASQEALPRSEWPLFLSYRRETASLPIADWLHAELGATTVESDTGVHTISIYYDRHTRVTSDFQKPLHEHLRHSRALVLIASAGAAECRRSENVPDYLYDELEWWHENRQTPPIILVVDDEAATRLVAQQRFHKWVNATRYECFWGTWSQDEKVLLRERSSLLAIVRTAVRDYGKIVEIEEVKRLRALVWRLRLLLAGVIALGSLFLTAAYFFNVARVEAKAQELTARSRAFAALSISRPANEYELPVLLALKAVRLNDNVQTRQALLSGLERSPSFVCAWQTKLDWISAVGMRPGHRQILLRGTTNRAALWDCRTGRPISHIKLPLAATYHWSPDGLKLAWTDTDNHLGVHDLTTGATTWTVRDFADEPYAWFNDVSWSPNGEVIASVEGHDDQWIVLRQPSTGVEIGRHGEHGKAGLAWEQGGGLLLAAGPDGVKIWAPFDGWREVASLDGTRTTPVWSVTLNAWVWLALKGHLCLWSPAFPEELVRVPVTNPDQETAALALSPDGSSAACSSYDGLLSVVDLRQRTISWTLKMTESTDSLPDSFDGVSWSPDGRWIAGRVTNFQRSFRATNSESLKIVSVEQRAVIRECVGGTAVPEGFTFWLDDSRRLISADHNGAVFLWDRVGELLREEVVGGKPIYELRRDASSQHLAGATGDTLFAWDAHTGQTTERKFQKDVETLAISPDGKQIAVLLDKEDAVLLCDQDLRENGRVTFPTIDGVLHALAWHPDRQLLAVGAPGRLSLLRTPGGEIEQEVPNETPEEQAAREERAQTAPTYADIAWSADGNWLATVDGQSDLVLWRFDGKLKRCGSVAAHRPTPKTITWSPDSTRLATGGNDEMARVWSVPGLRLIAELRGHDSPVDMVDWSSDGRLIVTSGGDNTIRIWEAATGRLVFALPTTDDSSIAVWCRSNRFLAVSGRNGLRLWNIHLPDWLTMAERTVLPRLSIARDRYTLESGMEGTILSQLKKIASRKKNQAERSPEDEGAELSTAAELAESIRARLRAAEGRFPCCFP